MDIEKVSTKSAINNIKIAGSLSNVDPDAVVLLMNKAVATPWSSASVSSLVRSTIHSYGLSTNSKRTHLCQDGS